MKPNPNPNLVVKEPAAGAIPEIQTAGLKVIVWVLLVAACFAASVLLKLPQVMDAAARPGPSVREISARAAPKPIHVSDPGRPAMEAGGASAGAELATWRLRASD